MDVRTAPLETNERNSTSTWKEEQSAGRGGEGKEMLGTHFILYYLPRAERDLFSDLHSPCDRRGPPYLRIDASLRSVATDSVSRWQQRKPANVSEYGHPSQQKPEFEQVDFHCTSSEAEGVGPKDGEFSRESYAGRCWCFRLGPGGDNDVISPRATQLDQTRDVIKCCNARILPRSITSIFRIQAGVSPFSSHFCPQEARCSL